ncbi:MAG: TlyA family RNA methyltransferase [Acidobacteriota bacterium]
MNEHPSLEPLRLDRALVELGLAESRQRAQQAIRAGLVSVNGAPVFRTARQVILLDRIVLTAPPEPYVSRAGRKLKAALDSFAVSAQGVVALDIGASTGGFTDCLLQHGAARVHAVDVGHGQLHPRLREDPRVVVYEGVNARHLPDGVPSEPCGMMVMDVSFISVLKVLPGVLPVLPQDAQMVVLVKPQFEAGPQGIGKGGVVRNEVIRERALGDCVAGMKALGIQVLSHQVNPVPGTDGNVEYTVHGCWAPTRRRREFLA